MQRSRRMGMGIGTTMSMSISTTMATTTATATRTAPMAITATERMPRVLKAAAPTSPAVLLQLMWLASPALPVGGFSYSEALESAVEAGLVADEAQAGRWLADQFHLSLARSDIPVVHRA